MRATNNWAAVSLISAGLILVGPSAADAQSLFTERGFSLTRDSFSPLPYEHVDPLTGNLLLTFTDLVLPGPAGFDLAIQRSYNSKIYQSYPNGTSLVSEDSWAGVGWTLHFGRMWGYDSQSPSFESPDGGRRQFFPIVGSTTRFMSRDFWEYDWVTKKVKLPNGRIHSLDAIGTMPGGQALLVTRTADPFGNRIDVSYPPPIGEAIQSVTQTLGAQSRTVTFQRNGTTGSLTSMTYNSGQSTRTWTYTQVALPAQPAFTLLTNVQPPAGGAWTFLYTSADPKHMLRKITTPNGGTIDYTYEEFRSRLGSAAEVPFLGVRTRTTGGRAVVPGTWTFSYAQPVAGARNETYIDEPGGRRLIERFKGVGSSNFSGVPSWQIGLPEFREVKVGSTSVKAETLAWRTPAFAERISDASEALGVPNSPIYLQLLDSRTVALGSSSFKTEYTYHTTSFNDYGRPYQVEERQTVGSTVGPTRTTTQTFKYGFTPYIFDRVESETVSIESESFATRSYGWNLANGFQTSETVLGVTTTFAPTAQGDRASRTDGLGHQTVFTYDWGSLKNTTPPVSGTQTTRVINPDGTVESETRRGFTTTLSYDGLFRQTVLGPPLGNNTVTTYDNGGEFLTTTRGPNISGFTTFLKTTLDGFGRPIATEDSAGVKTKTTINPLGLATFKSLPFVSPATGAVGTTLFYDALDRLTTTVNPDSGSTLREYDGISVTITDELNRKTRQVWQAFGDPSRGRLTSVTMDYQGGGFGGGLEQTTGYTYNALDALRTVALVGSGANPRTFTYNSKNQLESEQHPEVTGSVTYEYYDDGSLKTRTDPHGPTTFHYDANNRLERIDRPGTLDDVNPITYDGSDNRKGFTTGLLGSAQSPRIVALMDYDANNRLTSRTDTINGHQFITGYEYDGNDNLERVTYPTGVVARYEYDAANRVRAAKDLAGSYFYASTIEYHPSGAVSSFKPGPVGGPLPVQTFTFDPQTYRPRTVATGVGAFSSTYAYDFRGNVTGSTQALLSPGQAIPCGSGLNLTQCFAYDRLDRLEAITHGPGAGGFTYTPNGDRLTQTTLGSTATYTYTGSTQRLSTVNSVPVSHDNSGNLTLDASGASFTYTPENMMRTATKADATTTYWYDADGLRKGKVPPTSAATDTSLYIHGPGNALLAEYQLDCSATARPVRSYVYAGGRLIASVRPAASPNSVAFDTTSQTVGEAVGTVSAAVRLTTANGQPLPCDMAVSYSTVNGTATAAGGDFVSTTQTITFLAGDPSGKLRPATVTISNDPLNEDTESFTLMLNPVAGIDVSAVAHQVSITDNDPLPAVSVASASPVSENGGLPLSFQVNLTPVSGRTVRVLASTAPGSASPADYGDVSTPEVTFAAGESSKTVTVSPVGDLIYEANETVLLNLSSPTNATIGVGQGTGTIQNDDNAPSASISDAIVAEGAAGSKLLSFTVLLTPASGLPAVVDWSTADGTATVAGGDYVANSGRLSFSAGDSSRQISVTINGDLLFEPDETVFVNLAQVNADAGVGDAQGVGTITNDDDQKPIVTTEAATGITATTVAFNGTVNPNGLSTSVVYEYGTTLAYGLTTGSTNVGSGVATTFPSVPATGLTCNTLYHFRIVATNSAGSSTGDDRTFLTSACAPSLTSTAAQNVSTTSADLAGNVTSDGGAAITERGFVFSVTTTNPDPLIGGTGVTRVTLAGTVGAFSTTVSSLASSTSYAFRAFATNSAGTTYSPVANFTTSDPATALALVARTIAVNSASQNIISNGAPQVWYRVRLFANRSYQISAWPVGHDQGGDAAKLSVAMFSDNAGIVQANGMSGSSGVLEATANQGGDDKPFTATLQPSATGVYKIRVLRVSGGAVSHTVNLMLRETTLFSPWASRAAGYEGFIEMHNNTRASVSVTLRAYGSTGALLGSAVTFSIPAEATVFKTAGDLGVPLEMFAGIVLTHNGASGAISANLTTLNGTTGLSFDSPFTPRDGALMGRPVR